MSKTILNEGLNMALIKCPECGKEVSNSAEQCIHCGFPLKGKPCPKCGAEVSPLDSFCGRCGFSLKEKPLEPVMLNVPSLSGFPRGFTVSYPGGGVSGTSGETVEFTIKKPETITFHLNGYFGSPSLVVNPGDKIQVNIGGFGNVTLAKVSALTGNSNTYGW